MQDLILEVERLIWKGRALAREKSGRVVLLQPGVFPGERVRARVVKEKRDHLQAEWQEIIRPSSQRRPHPCSRSDLCGGCRFGALPQREQLRLKREMLLSEVRRSLGSKWADYAPQEVFTHPSPAGWRYRWRGQVEVRQGSPHLKALGSRELVPSPDCLLFSRVLSEGVKRLSHGLQPGRWTMAASPWDGAVRVEGSSNWLRLPLKEYGLLLRVPAGSFFQANWSLNRDLVGFVQSRLAEWERVADFFAGAGNFALPLAAKGARVVALESDPQAALGARIAAEKANLDNLRIQCRDLRRKDPLRLMSGFRPQALLLDPPRTGAGKRLANLARMDSLQRLIWISCDVVNTSRDLLPFLEAGWRIRETALFDMFPQTWHLEAVFVLDREYRE